MSSRMSQLASLGEAVLHLTADHQDLTSDLRRAEQITTDSMRQMQGAVSGSLGNIGGFFERAFSFATGGIIQNALTGITNEVRKLGNALIQGNADFEQYETRFKVLLGSASEAKQRIEELTRFAVETPFELPGIVRADTILQGFGMHSEEAARKFGMSGQEILRVVGDTASGTGAGLEQIALALGRFSTGVIGEAMERFSMLGAVTRAELQKMGVEFNSAGALTSPLGDAMSKLLILLKEKYGGMMQEQARTFEGMKSNLEDWKNNTLRTLGKPIFEVLKEQLQGLLDYLMSPATAQAIDRLATELRRIIEVAMEVATKAYTWGRNIVERLADGISKAVSAVMAALSPIADTLTYWLAPGSPPRLLPDLTLWGQGAAQAYLDGFRDADFGVLDFMSKQIEEALLANVGKGEMSPDEFVAQMLGSREGIGKALAELRETGNISEETIEGVAKAAGPAGDAVRQMLRDLAATGGDPRKMEEVLRRERQLAALRAEENRLRKEAIKLEQELAEAELAKAEAATSSGGGRGKAGLTDAERAAAAQWDYDYAIADTAKRLEMLRAKQAAYKAGSAEYWQLQREIYALEQQQSAERNRADQEGAEAKWALNYQMADTAGKLEMLRAKQAQVTEGSAEYYRLQQEIYALEQQKAAEAQRQAEQKLRDEERLKEARWQYQYALADEATKLKMLQDKLAGTSKDSAEYYELSLTLQQMKTRKLEEEKRATDAAAEARWQYDYALADEATRMRMLEERLAGTKKGTNEYYQLALQLEQMKRAAADEAAAKTEAATEAEWEYRFAIADTAEQIRMLEEKLAGTTRGSVEYYDILRQIARLREQEKTEAERLAGQQTAAHNQAEAEAKRIADAQFRYNMAIADTAGKLALLRQKLATVKQGSAEYYDILTQIARLEEEERQKATRQASMFAPERPQRKTKPTPTGPRGRAPEEPGVFDQLLAKAPLVAAIVAGLKRNFDAIAGAVLGAAAAIAGPLVAVGLGDLLALIPTIIPWLLSLLSPVNLLIAGAAVLGVAIATNFLGIRDAVVAVITDVLAFLQTLWGYIQTWVSDNQVAFERLGMAFEWIKQAISTAAQYIWGVMQWAWPGIQAIIVGVWEAIKSIIGAALQVILGVIGFILNLITGNWEGAWQNIQNIGLALWNGIKGLLEGVLAAILGVFGVTLDEAEAWWEQTWNSVSEFASTTWQTIFSGISGFVGDVYDEIVRVITAAKEWLESTWNSVSEFASTTWQTIFSGISGFVGDVYDEIVRVITAAKEWLESTWGLVLSAVDDTWESIRDTVRTWLRAIRLLVDGMADGLRDAIVAPFNAAKDLIDRVLRTIQDLLGSIRFPHIAMPHIRVTWNESGIPGVQLPSFNVDWYAKGLDAIISGATLIGVGEKGPERVTVRPLSKKRAFGNDGVTYNLTYIDQRPGGGPPDLLGTARRLEWAARMRRATA